MARTSGTKTREQMLQMGFNAMPPEKARKYQSLGGRISQAHRRRKKLLREIANDILSMKLQNEEEITAALREGGLDDEDIDYAAGIILAQAIKAMGGDTRAAEFIRDTSGQKPSDSLQVGNLDSKPFEMIDFSGLNDAQLHEMINARVEKDYD